MRNAYIRFILSDDGVGIAELSVLSRSVAVVLAAITS